MRLLVIGNSQAAALRLAVAESLPPGAIGAARHGQLEVFFYVLPGADGPKLRRDGNRLKPKTADRDAVTTIGGAVADGVDPAEFDAVLVSAAGLPPDRGRPGHVVTDLTIAELAPGTATGVSRAVFARAMVAAYGAGNAWKSITLLREAVRGPLLIESWAMPTAAVLTRGESAGVLTRGKSAGVLTRGKSAAALTRGESAAVARYGVSDFFAWYAGAQRAMLAELVARDLGEATLLPHPAAAAGPPGFTADAYRTGDPWHMNARYGALVLDAAAAALGL